MRRVVVRLGDGVLSPGSNPRLGIVTPPSRWSGSDAPRGDAYDARWQAMAERGENPHGEVDFLMVYEPTRVLDAGCGTGRVAVELDRRGVSVVGVDLDAAMLATAREKHPGLRWDEADLSRLELAVTFDLVVAAGNVMIFLAPGTEASTVQRLAVHLEVGGLLVSGFQLKPGRYGVAEYDEHAAAAGLELVDRFAGWDRESFAGGDYAVSVHRRA